LLTDLNSFLRFFEYTIKPITKKRSVTIKITTAATFTHEGKVVEVIVGFRLEEEDG